MALKKKKKKIKPNFPKKLPNLSPSKLPRYPSIQRQDIKDDKTNGNNDTSENEDILEIKKKKKKLDKRNTSLGLTERAVKEKVEESFKKKEDDNGTDITEPRRSKKKQKKSEETKDEEEAHKLSASVEEDGSVLAVKKDKKNQMKSPSKTKAIKSTEKATSSPTKQKG